MVTGNGMSYIVTKSSIDDKGVYQTTGNLTPYSILQ